MACLLVPVAEAIIVEGIRRTYKKKEVDIDQALPTSKKLEVLRNLLLGGGSLLFFEHVWHGEIVFWFPFLTAMKSPEETYRMLHEMATVGVMMALVVTLVWAVLMKVVTVANRKNEVKA